MSYTPEKKTILVLLIGLCIGGGVVGVAWKFHGKTAPAAGVSLAANNTTTSLADTEVRQVGGNLRFVSPLLSCGIDSVISSNGAINAIQSDVNQVIADAKKKNTITDSGIYFKEFNDGSSFYINEAAKFTPGSLLKVPLALSLLRRYVSDPTFAKTPILYDGGAQDFPQAFPAEKTAEKGKTYTFDELLTLSLVYSDNIATQILSQMLTRTEINDAYSDLGIDVPQNNGDDYTMSVRTYGSFFRILYNGTYLPPFLSDRVLELLSHSTFTQGLVAGVPQGVAVAHKFGERERGDNEPAQLHDCGIVYKAKHPYLLCVMLRGNDIQALPDVIANVSRTVYQDLDK